MIKSTSIYLAQSDFFCRICNYYLIIIFAIIIFIIIIFIIIIFVIIIFVIIILLGHYYYMQILCNL